MVFRLHFLGEKNPLDDAFFVDDEGGAERAHVFPSVHAFLAPGPEGFCQPVVGVGDQREGQLVLFDELLVRLGVVDADADDFIARLLQLAVVVAQVAGLGRTARGHVLGVEIEYHFLPLVVAQPDFLSGFVGSQVVGSFFSGIHMLVRKCCEADGL